MSRIQLDVPDEVMISLKETPDTLVDMDPDRSLFDLGGLHFDLEALLGRAVDVVTEGDISPYLKERILAEARPL